jgi:hypothetical protein
MPNHTSQRLTIKADEKTLKEIREKVYVDDEHQFDANRIIAMPAELHNTESNTNPAYEEQRKKNTEKYGFPTWYEWANAIWGTKWGIYDAVWDGNVVTFQSAWSPAHKIIAALSKDFPEATFYLDYADEGGGFLGVMTIKNGEIDDNPLEWKSKDGKKLRRILGN